MGNTLNISLDRALPGVDTICDRVFLAEIVGDDKSLNALSMQLGIPSLSAFQSYATQDLGDLLDDADEGDASLPNAKIEWFDPSEALRAIPRLIEHYEAVRFVRKRGQFVGGKWEPLDRTSDLVRELRDLEKILSAAAAQTARFRLHIEP